MLVLSKLDVITIISFILSIIGTGTSIWGLVNTGLIKKAVREKQSELINKLKFITHRTTYLNSVKNIKEVLSSRESTQLSSDQIKEFSFKMEESVKWLKDCSMHFSDEDKKKTEEIANRLEKINRDQHFIFDGTAGNELRQFSQDLFLMLSKEDYYL